MKPPYIFRLAIIALASLACAATADELSDLMIEAQRAYGRGDFAGAKMKFDMVHKMEPGNKTAISYLRRIAADEAAERAKKGSGNATQAALQTLIMEKVDLREASLAEALEFLRQKCAQISGGKTTVNFVLQVDEQTQNAKVTLSLQKVPFAEVLRYAGDLANVQFSYEKFAIVVKPKTVQPVSSGPADVQGSTKIPGLN